MRFLLRAGVIRVIGAGYWRKENESMKKKVNYADDRGEMPEKLFVVSEDI